MSLSCTIQIENSNEFYRPGEVIKGLVILNVNSTSSILIKALSIQFIGYASCKWEKPRKVKKSGKPKPVVYIENREDYISTTNYLIGSEQANPEPLRPGNYTYNFMVNIPKNIPSTFESPFGYIRYLLVLNADYIDRIACLYTIAVHIEQLKDLRSFDPSLQLPNYKETQEHKSCVKFWEQPLQLCVNIPQVGFIAGECICIHIKLTNLEKLKLKDITSNLNRKVFYIGFIKEKKLQTTSETTTIASNIHSLFGQNSNVIQHLQQLQIPKTPLSLGMDECKCIGLSYELEVLVTCQKKKRSVKATIPIVIGSISLTSDVKVLPANVTSTSNNVSLITVAQSMDELALPSSMDIEENSIFQQSAHISASMTSLASSFQEAEFMTAVKLNKKSKNQLNGNDADFRPKYLYYDLPNELQQNLQDSTATTSQQINHNQNSEMQEKL